MNKPAAQQGYKPSPEEERLAIKHQLYPTVAANTLNSIRCIHDNDSDELIDYIEYLADGIATKMQQNLHLIEVEQKKPHLLVN